MLAHAIKPSTWEKVSGRKFEFKASLMLQSKFQDIQSHIVRPCIIKPKTKIQKTKTKANKNPTQTKRNKTNPPNLITQFMFWWYYPSIFSPYIFFFFNNQLLSTPAKMKKEERVRKNC